MTVRNWVISLQAALLQQAQVQCLSGELVGVVSDVRRDPYATWCWAEQSAMR